MTMPNVDILRRFATLRDFTEAELSTVASGAPGFAGKTARDLADERGDRRLVAFIDRHAER